MNADSRTDESQSSAEAATRYVPPLARQIALNSVFNFAGRAVYVAGWTLITPYMLHRLGPERFGLWSLLTVVAGVYLAFDFGLAGALTKFVAEFRATGDRAAMRGVYTLGAAFYLGLSLAAIAAVAVFRAPILGLFRIAPELRVEASTALLAAAVAYALMNLYAFLSSVLGGLHRMDLWNRISMTVTLLQLAGVWLVLSRGGGVTALFVNTGVALVAGIAIAHVVVRRLAPDARLAPPPYPDGLLARLTRYGATLQIVNVGVLVQFQLDKVLFGSMLSLSAVGDFELGYRVVVALWSVPWWLLPPLLPAAAHLDAVGDRERIVRLYRRASRYVLAAAFPIAVGVVTLAPALYQAWLGPGHANASRAATALAAMLGVNILTGVGTAIARGVGRPGLEARYQIAALVLHLAGSLLLIPRFGFVGGLWALFVSTSVASLYFVWSFHRFLGEPLGRFARDVVVPPLVSAVAAGLVTAALARLITAGPLVGFVAEAAAYGVTAGALLLVTRAIGLGDVREMAALVAGRSRGGTAGAA